MSGGSQIFFGAATPACWTVPWALGSLILLHNINRVKLDYEHKQLHPQPDTPLKLSA